jgi:multiple sugar transport system permease protein
LLGLIDSLTGIDIRPNVLNSVWTFYLPALFGVGIRSGIIIYIYIQFFKGLPKELEEAAWIDGAGPFKTYLRIALPSSGVVITTVTVFSLIWHWNDYSLSSMYLYFDSWPLAVKLNNITTPEAMGTLRLDSSDPMRIAIMMAGCLMFILPILIVYLILQKKFVKSIDRVGITG